MIVNKIPRLTRERIDDERDNETVAVAVIRTEEPGSAEAPMPVPASNELLIRVGAVSLNYRDKLVVEGELLPDRPTMPFVPVSDMAGEIVAIGAAVSRFKVVDRVLGNFWTQSIDGEAPREMTRHGLSLGGPLPGVLAEYMRLHEGSPSRRPHR